MRKKLTLTIDSEVYDVIKELPRKVSISEVFSYILKAMCQDIKKGGELTDKELQAWIDKNPELKDFQERMIEQWGPRMKKIDNTIGKIKTAVVPKRGKTK